MAALQSRAEMETNLEEYRSQLKQVWALVFVQLPEFMHFWTGLSCVPNYLLHMHANWAMPFCHMQVEELLLMDGEHVNDELNEMYQGLIEVCGQGPPCL